MRHLRAHLIIAFAISVSFQGTLRELAAQDGIQRVVFWGVLAHDVKITQNQWIPLAIYSDQRSAEAAGAILQRNGLTPRVLRGYATDSELGQHAITAERGRGQLQQLLTADQINRLQTEFTRTGGFDERQRNTINRNGFDPIRRNTIENGGFDPGRRQTIENAGFDSARRQTIENAGFDPFRRRDINTSRFPLAPNVAGPAAGNRGTFGTQPGQRAANARGNFGTQPGQRANTARGNFGTQPSPKPATNRKGAFGTQ